MKGAKQLAIGLSVTAALALPSSALARHGGDDNRPSSTDQAQGQRDDSGSHDGVRDVSSQPRMERYELRGSVVSTDAASDTVVVSIKKANHGRRGRGLVGQQVTLDLSAARLRVADSNGDGVRDVNDIQPGDAVRARVELPKAQPADLTQPLAASRFEDRTSVSEDTASHA